MSTIEWTDKTWNPIAGCRRVSPGCDNCYAIREARRKDGTIPKYAGVTTVTASGVDWSGHFNFSSSSLNVPRGVRKPTIWFVNSMSDLFGEGVTDHEIAQIFKVMNETPHHTYQFLTKRANRMVGLASQLHWTPNIWAGVSIESDKFVGRARALAKVPAALRFISAEPLLGDLPSLDLTDIGWLIVGGESGPSSAKLRPIDPQWVRNIRDRCGAANVPFFFKQWGNFDEHGVFHRSKKDTGHLLDGTEYFEMPATVSLAVAKKSASVATATPVTVVTPVASGRIAFRAAILSRLQSGPMTATELRAANGASAPPHTNLHSWALVDLQREGRIAKRLDGSYGLKVRVRAA